MQRLIGLALALITAGSAQAQEEFSTLDIPPTIQAARVQATVHLYGDLIETDWQRVVRTRGFRHAEPHRGNPATFDTEFRINIVDECTSPVGSSRMAVKSTLAMRATT